MSKIRNKGWGVSFTLNVPTFFGDATRVIDNNFYDSSGKNIGYYDTSTITYA